MRALWQPDVLRDAGLTVTTEPGWETRGRDDPTWMPFGRRLDPKPIVLVHHTGSARRSGELPSLTQVAYRGNPGVPAPLANLMLGRDTGRWHVVASGISNNAGEGSWYGRSGNRNTLGIEAENSGILNPDDRRYEPWGTEMYASYVRGVAALLDYLETDTQAGMCLHKEWAPGRKPDASFDAAKFHADVHTSRGGLNPIPQPSPEDPMIVPCLYPASKRGPQPQAGNRTAYFTTLGRLIIGWNSASVAGDRAYPTPEHLNPQHLSDDECSVRGLTFRFLEVPVAAGHHLTGLWYFTPAAGGVDPTRLTAFASNGGTFTYEVT